VTLKVPPGTRSGQELRLSGRGMKRATGDAGHLHAIVRIEVPTVVDDRQKALYKELAEISTFDPRAQLEQEAAQ
jgi:curved DNA-binding protein